MEDSEIVKDSETVGHRIVKGNEMVKDRVKTEMVKDR